jgi:hypothetical protein
MILLLLVIQRTCWKEAYPCSRSLMNMGKDKDIAWYNTEETEYIVSGEVVWCLV